MFALRFILVLVLVVSNVFANCDFDSKFADVYVAARKKYADSLHYQRDQVDRNRKPTSGFFRAKKFGANWEKVGIKEHALKMFNGAEVVIESRMGGKMLIYAKDKKLNSKIIVFDPSGDYFRITEPTIRNGKYYTDKDSRHFDLNGEEMKRPAGISHREWRDYEEAKTHFKAEF